MALPPDITVVVVVTNPNGGGGNGGGSVDLTPLNNRVAALETKQAEDEIDIPSILARLAVLESGAGLPPLPSGYARLAIQGDRLVLPTGDYLIARVA